MLDISKPGLLFSITQICRQGVLEFDYLWSAVRFSPRAVFATKAAYSHYYKRKQKALNGKCFFGNSRKSHLNDPSNQAMSVLLYLPPFD